jgi:hypothetical protein
MSTLLRRLAVLACLVLAVAGLTSIASAAKSRSDSGTAWLSANHTAGGLLVVSGDVQSKLFGHAAIVYRVKASGQSDGSVKVTSNSVTLYTDKGALSGTGYGTQTADAAGNVTVTDGHIALTKGTGKLKGHALTATFDGPLKDGVYTFKYKGTYK